MIRFSLKGIMSLAIAGLATACSPEHDSQPASIEWNLVGEYLGQQPPGSEVELFAPGYISTSMSEANSVFSPDGNEFYFAVWPGPGHGVKVFSTHVEDGRWTIPEVPDFLRGVSAIDVAMTADGQRFFFCSNRSRTPGGPTEDNFDIWYVDRESDGHWGEPVNPGEPLNSDRADYYPTVTGDGTMYFHSSREGGLGGRDIYRAELVDGRYQIPENVGAPINTSGNEGDVLVAPDESFLIFNSHGHDPEENGSSLWISFRGEDETGWLHTTWAVTWPEIRPTIVRCCLPTADTSSFPAIESARNSLVRIWAIRPCEKSTADRAADSATSTGWMRPSSKGRGTDFSKPTGTLQNQKEEATRVRHCRGTHMAPRCEATMSLCEAWHPSIMRR